MRSKRGEYAQAYLATGSGARIVCDFDVSDPAGQDKLWEAAKPLKKSTLAIRGRFASIAKGKDQPAALVAGMMGFLGAKSQEQNEVLILRLEGCKVIDAAAMRLPEK